MKVIRTKNELKECLSINNEKKVGFIPTMGYLHEGHTSLMDVAKLENDLIVSSIFVNPLQFGPNEDFEEYPRDESQDIKTAKDHGVDILFIPSNNEMYPNKMTISMQVNEISTVLCGRTRPGHFNGVVTVLTKLFNLIEPNNAYFGLKDAQQFAVVDRLVHDLNFPIKLNGLPTIREVSGLAKSSRNVNLTKSELAESVWLYRSLKAAQELMIDGENESGKIVNEIEKTITKQTTGKIDYVEVYAYPSLKPVTKINEQIIIAIAIQFKGARLIDNLIIDQNGNLIERI